MNYKMKIALSVTALAFTLAQLGCGGGTEPRRNRVIVKGSNSQDQQPAGGEAGGQGTAGNNPGGETPAGEMEVKDLTANHGIRNFRQINETMSLLTGIPASTAAVQTAFTDLQTQMPDNNDVRAFVPSHQVAITKLAVEYCDAMILNTTLRAQVIPNFNFQQAPRAAFTPANKKLIAEALIKKFWGDGRNDIEDMGMVVQTLEKLVDEMMTGKDANSVPLTANIVKGVCTSVLSASPVTML